MMIIASGKAGNGVRFNICSGCERKDEESVRAAVEEQRKAMRTTYENIARRGNPDELKRMEAVRRKYGQDAARRGREPVRGGSGDAVWI